MLSHVTPPVISLDVQKMQIIMATNIAKVLVLTSPHE